MILGEMINTQTVHSLFDLIQSTEFVPMIFVGAMVLGWHGGCPSSEKEPPVILLKLFLVLE